MYTHAQDALKSSLEQYNNDIATLKANMETTAHNAAVIRHDITDMRNKYQPYLCILA